MNLLLTLRISFLYTCVMRADNNVPIPTGDLRVLIAFATKSERTGECTAGVRLAGYALSEIERSEGKESAEAFLKSLPQPIQDYIEEQRAKGDYFAQNFMMKQRLRLSIKTPGELNRQNDIASLKGRILNCVGEVAHMAVISDYPRSKVIQKAMKHLREGCDAASTKKYEKLFMDFDTELFALAGIKNPENKNEASDLFDEIKTGIFDRNFEEAITSGRFQQWATKFEVDLK